MKASQSMGPGRTYSIRRLTTDRHGNAEYQPIMTLRTVRSDLTDLAMDWVERNLEEGTTTQIDVGDAWRRLCEASDGADFEVVDCRCSWCFPGAKLPPGETQGICDGCKDDMEKEHYASTAVGHGICHACDHVQKPGTPTYHPGAWCYMFKDGSHVDRQGYCGQFKSEVLQQKKESFIRALVYRYGGREPILQDQTTKEDERNR